MIRYETRRDDNTRKKRKGNIMKLFKTILLSALLVITLTGCVNHNRVDTLIFEYTEHMEIYEHGDSNDGDDLLYYGDSTLGVKQDGEAAILVTRWSKDQDTIIGFAFMGELYDGLFEDGSFFIELGGFITYSIKHEQGYQISLETSTYIADELMTVDFVSYIEALKELTYDDILYAMETTLQRSY